ncbi:unnamed protein product [Meloidogyne enterolobii]|uniref:Uncharacterized protein n=1 Tax=Meloidogyne enterolobii TaxID=390850 RepID=A0ACB0ZGA9_MELEN
MRYATKHPSIVDALVLINPISQKAGWIEWFYQKVFLVFFQLMWNTLIYFEFYLAIGTRSCPIDAPYLVYPSVLEIVIFEKLGPVLRLWV